MVADLADYKKATEELLEIAKTKNCGPILIRLSWHDAGTYEAASKTGGPRGTIRFAPESEHGANKGLNIARELIQAVKDKYPNISHADFYVLSAIAAVRAMGGPIIPFRPGRVDGEQTQCAPDGRLPDATQGASHIRDVFYRMGFDDRGIVALSGAHTVGRCHPDRSGFTGPWTAQPLVFDNSYFVHLIKDTWQPKPGTGKPGEPPLQYEDAATQQLMMLPTDLVLVQDERFKPVVDEYAASQDKFFADFVKYFKELQEKGWETQLGAEMQVVA